MIGKVLDETYVKQLYDLFTEKHWDVKSNGVFSIFDRFCRRLAELDKDEYITMILQLTDKYLWIPEREYEKRLHHLFYTVTKDLPAPPKKKHYGICPLLGPNDFDKIKSSSHLLYMCCGESFMDIPVFLNQQIRVYQSPPIMLTHMKSVDHIFLIDDYIGSGETGIGAVKYLTDHGVPSEKMTILVLAAQYEGMQLILEESGVHVETEVLRRKGIEMVYPDSEWELRRNQMKLIGKKLKVKEENYYLGRGDVEGLITMNRTPNNTFPFYWYQDKNITTYAPFPRSTVKAVNQ